MARISDAERLRRLLESAGGTVGRQEILEGLSLSVDRYSVVCSELMDMGVAERNPGRLGGLRLIDSRKPRRRISRSMEHPQGAPSERTRSGSKHITLGEVISRALDNKDMSQRDLARRLDVTPLTVCKWVNHRNEPRGHNLKNLKRFLSLSSGPELAQASGTGEYRQKISKPSFQGGSDHQDMQRRLYDLGRTMGFVVHTNKDIGGGHRPDVLWYKLDPDTHEGVQPHYVFEIELGPAIQKSLATLKHAYDLGNADLGLLVPKRKRRTVDAKVDGAFHEIQKKLKIYSVEDCPKNVADLKDFLEMSS